MIPGNYDQLSTSAVLFDRRAGWLSVEGPDRASWLQGMVSNDVERLEPGEGCLAAHLTAQGKVVALMSILADPGQLWLLATDQSGEALREALDRLLIMEEATIVDRSSQFRFFSLIGPQAPRILGDLDAMPEHESAYSHRVTERLRAAVSPTGFELIVPDAGVSGFIQSIEAAGVAHGDEALSEVARVERGVPRWGVDVDSHVTLPELGEEAIDYEKGCYIGQEVVAKIRYLGHVNRKFMGLRVSGDRVPNPSPVHRNGREVGRLTSAVWSPALDGVLGLGFLRRGSDAPGTQVEIQCDGMSVPAVVSDLPS